MRIIQTPLDKLSNRALDTIEADDFDKAEQLCRNLLRKYPKVLDGHDRMAMLREAQGRFQEAAKHYAKMLKIIEKNPRGFDQETIHEITQLRDQALAHGQA